MASENTSIGFKMREKLRLESDSFSVSQFWTASVNMKFSIMLVFCNVQNKIRKRTDTVVAFTQEYSRVSYPLRNVSTLSTGSGPSKDTRASVEKTEERTFYIENLCLEEEITSPLYFELKVSTDLCKPVVPICALSDIRTWRITKRLEQGCHHLPATSTNRGTIRQLSDIVQPRHHVSAFPYQL